MVRHLDQIHFIADDFADKWLLANASSSGKGTGRVALEVWSKQLGVVSKMILGTGSLSHATLFGGTGKISCSSAIRDGDCFWGLCGCSYLVVLRGHDQGVAENGDFRFRLVSAATPLCPLNVDETWDVRAAMKALADSARELPKTKISLL
jgi:hypothetical protein